LQQNAFTVENRGESLQKEHRENGEDGVNGRLLTKAESTTSSYMQEALIVITDGREIYKRKRQMESR
jgi:hypothetical protein